MSRSVELQENPAVRTFKWKNSKFDKKSKTTTQECGWHYYDKNLLDDDGKGTNVLVPFPLTFLWLESAMSFSGFNEKAGKGVYSNEILNTKEAKKKYGDNGQTLSVKIDGEEIAKGFYKDIKEAVKGEGGKFCAPVYAAMEIDGEYEVVRFLMTGASGSSWIEFSNNNKNRTHAVVCHDFKEVDMKTGATYEAPVFKYVEATEEQNEAANELAEKVDAFFDYQYLPENQEKVNLLEDADVDYQD